MNVITPRFVFKLVSCWLVVAGLCFGKDEVPFVAQEFRFSEPLPDVSAWAKANGGAIGSIEMATERKEMALGDEVVVLAELTKKSKRQQWLIRLRYVKPTSDELKEKPVQNYTLNVISGRAHPITWNPCALETEVVGPFVAGKKNDDPDRKKGRAVVFQELLANGFYGLPPWFKKLHDIKKQATEEERAVLNRNWWSFNKPHAPERLAIGQALTTKYGVTADEEYDYFTHWSSLLTFFGVIAETPGMRGVLFEACSISWASILWDMVRGQMPRPSFHGDAGPTMTGEKWGLGAETEVRTLPHSARLKSRRVIRFNLAVVEPRPPLANTAGIIGFAAMHPGHDDVHVMMRVVGAKAAAVN